MKIVTKKLTSIKVSLTPEDTDAAKLLPCPFCGNAAHFITQEIPVNSYGTSVALRIGVTCVMCLHDDDYALYTNRFSQIVKWNRGKCLRLRKAVDELTRQWNMRVKL